MKGMIFDGLTSILWISLSQELIVNSNTIIGECFSMTVIDTFADLQKFEIVLNGFLVLFDIIVQDPD